MKVKIVILNWNGRAHLERFLPSVVAHSGEASVVVADNGSNDDSVLFLREHYPQVELLQLDQNYGFAEGYNRALSRIEADCYVLLNSDVEVEEGWLNPLVARLAADEKVAALAPKIISYERKSDYEYAGLTVLDIRSVGDAFSIRLRKIRGNMIQPGRCFGLQVPAWLYVQTCSINSEGLTETSLPTWRRSIFAGGCS